MKLMFKLRNNLGQMRQHELWTYLQLEAYQAELLRWCRPVNMSLDLSSMGCSSFQQMRNLRKES
jgi:hypothetical protein